MIYLYIKKHKITGLKYFGFTKNNPYAYNGSGIYWKRHFRKHGKEHIQTLDVFGFSDLDLCSDFALSFSKRNDIVNSQDWANLMDENGTVTTTAGCELSDNIKEKISQSLKEYNKHNKTPSKLKGRKLSEEHKAKLSSASISYYENNEHPSKGKDPWNKDKKLHYKVWNKGKKTGPNSKESNTKRSETMSAKYKEGMISNRKGIPPWNKGIPNPGAGNNFNTERLKCPHCGKNNLNKGNYARWHGKKCRSLPLTM